jgi:hypothetical protein
MVKKKYKFITDMPFWKAMSKRNHSKGISVDYLTVNGNGTDRDGFNPGGPPRLLKIISTNDE